MGGGAQYKERGYVFNPPPRMSHPYSHIQSSRCIETTVTKPQCAPPFYSTHALPLLLPHPPIIKGLIGGAQTE